MMLWEEKLEKLRTRFAVIEIRNLRYSVQAYFRRKADRQFLAGCEWSPQQVATIQQPKD